MPSSAEAAFVVTMSELREAARGVSGAASAELGGEFRDRGPQLRNLFLPGVTNNRLMFEMFVPPSVNSSAASTNGTY